MPHTYKYPRAALTVDCVVFGLDDEDLKVLLIERGGEPFVGSWALPGGFVEIDETLEAAAQRELTEETSLGKVFLEQLYTFGQVDRDPRERVVTVAYFALVNIRDHRVRAATDARGVGWFAVANPPKLAFDHATILKTAHQRLKGKVRYQPIGFELLPPKFTLRQLQHLYETILERTLDKRNFRRKVLAMGFVEETNEMQQDVAHRAAKLFRFNEKKYRRLSKSGYLFEL
ncbi:MAG: NUDIX hydrolase [Pirellulales bacterium]|nr:NUDIX hydrolase [Pirellulales bacterium]